VVSPEKGGLIYSTLGIPSAITPFGQIY